jgi:hypothetical protein
MNNDWMNFKFRAHFPTQALKVVDTGRLRGSHADNEGMGD